MPGTSTCTVFVFHNVNEARVFNSVINGYYDGSIDGCISKYWQKVREWGRDEKERSIGTLVDIKVLPFAIIRPGDKEPKSDKIVSRFDNYPVERAWVIGGIDYLLRNGVVDAINLSLGPPGFEFEPKDPLQLATRFAHDMGIPVVVAAGNAGPAEGTLQPLARAPWVISVGATDDFGRLLEDSSRGFQNGPFPTVVALGEPEVHYIKEGWTEVLPGTSFAAPKVTRIVILFSKAFEIILGDLRDGNLYDASSSDWIWWNRVRLARFGLADTGVDPAAVNPLPEPVAKVVKQKKDHGFFPRTVHEAQWSAAMCKTLLAYDIPIPTKVTPDLLKRALEVIAQPITGCSPYEAGFGFVSIRLAYDALKALTPTKLVRIICPDWQKKISDTKLAQLDDELCNLWDANFVTTLMVWFYDGVLLKVARVIK
jgi:hypothetical protein